MTTSYKMSDRKLSFWLLAIFPQQTVYKWSLGHVSLIFIINIIICHKDQTKSEKLSFVMFMAVQFLSK